MARRVIHESDSPPIPLVELSHHDLEQIYNRVRKEMGYQEKHNLRFTRTHLIRLINRDYRRLRKQHEKLRTDRRGR